MDCPKCGNKNIVPIQYGYPTPEAVEDSKKTEESKEINKE